MIEAFAEAIAITILIAFGIIILVILWELW